MTSTAAATGRAVQRAHVGRTRGLWVLVVLVAALAVAGAGLGVVLLNRPPAQGPAAIGTPVRTAFGTFTVTDASTTFVPDTQGPPSAAQHNGTRGSDQLQVWVRLSSSRAKGPVPYSPSQFRLIGDSARPRGPDGSTLTAAALAPGASIDGQVWFDLTKGHRPTGDQWLEYLPPGGRAIRVPLGQAPPPPAQRPSPSSGGHSHAG